jgi:hypothetical protein
MLKSLGLEQHGVHRRSDVDHDRQRMPNDVARCDTLIAPGSGEVDFAAESPGLASPLGGKRTFASRTMENRFAASFPLECDFADYKRHDPIHPNSGSDTLPAEVGKKVDIRRNTTTHERPCQHVAPDHPITVYEEPAVASGSKRHGSDS